jgi:hypothetical protein
MAKQWHSRDLQLLNRLKDKYGVEDVKRQLDEGQSKPKRGRPKHPFDEGFWNHFGPILEGMYPNGIPKGMVDPVVRNIIKQMWQSHKETNDDKTLPPAVRKAWDHKKLGQGVDAITRRLTKQLREKT